MSGVSRGGGTVSAAETSEDHVCYTGGLRAVGRTPLRPVYNNVAIVTKTNPIVTTFRHNLLNFDDYGKEKGFLFFPYAYTVNLTDDAK